LINSFCGETKEKKGASVRPSLFGSIVDGVDCGEEKNRGISPFMGLLCLYETHYRSVATFARDDL
jgi:hypothetical protein